MQSCGAKTEKYVFFYSRNFSYSASYCGKATDGPVPTTATNNQLGEVHRAHRFHFLVSQSFINTYLLPFAPLLTPHQTSFNPGMTRFYEDPTILNSTDLEVTFYA